ncbi:O-Glycosyl hydrolase [Zunongwangia mangrovi]|uniref:O-Glycosyl hydrolase n=1 Tax=Zunongwangia mangrovi TaxID=1334022 RepID=A0A1I1HEB9_9FLAO|nr:glycoside hydrolase [Zunongwangia mangrovi]SFC21942.1 O-Glycosyl hydrolase [Zunongwangia mangrovi]
MKKNFQSFFFLLTLHLFFISCQQENNDKKKGTTEERTKLTSISIEDEVVFQTIDNFGASDAWSMQHIGNWPTHKKQKIAQLLFSQELDKNNNPLGIGLSLWRFNLGAGSAQQGADSGIADEWRRADSFLQLDGTYSWQRQSGQVWFAKAAKAYEVDQLLVFLNSPHVNFTRNNKAFSASGDQSNLAVVNYKKFADYLSHSIKGMENLGLSVDIISPFNEPQWDWADGGQEGTPFWNEEIAEITRLINKSFIQNNIETKIDLPETAQLNYLVEDDNKSGRGTQLDYFFNENSAGYIGDLEHLGKVISGHSYFTTSPTSKLVGERKKLNQALKDFQNLKFWMSEYCILGDNNGEIEGNSKDLSIEPALYMAKVIHHDLSIANASAWHWWTAVSVYDYKDGLIYADKNKKDGNFEESKMLWALGNYSRFIRPGAKRIQINSEEQLPEEILISGFRSPDNQENVLVIINPLNRKIQVQFKNNEKLLTPRSSYVTSSAKNLASVEYGTKISLTEKSITTLIFSK